jgi:hypothetical protein
MIEHASWNRTAHWARRVGGLAIIATAAMVPSSAAAASGVLDGSHALHLSAPFATEGIADISKSDGSLADQLSIQIFRVTTDGCAPVGELSGAAADLTKRITALGARYLTTWIPPLGVSSGTTFRFTFRSAGLRLGSGVLRRPMSSHMPEAAH